MKNQELNLTAVVVGGVIEYDDIGWRDKLNKFKEANEGKRIAMHFENDDSPAVGLHRYYRGYLLPDIAHALGERDKDYVHRYYLKKDFLFRPIDVLDEIKGKHRDRPTIYVKEIDGKIVVQGYAPSCGDITHKEMKDFVLACEHRLFVDLQGHLGSSVEGGKEAIEKYSEEAKKLRTRGMEDVTIKAIEEKFGEQTEMFG